MVASPGGKGKPRVSTVPTAVGKSYLRCSMVEPFLCKNGSMDRACVQWLVKRPSVNSSATLQGTPHLQTGVIGARTPPRMPSTAVGKWTHMRHAEGPGGSSGHMTRGGELGARESSGQFTRQIATHSERGNADLRGRGPGAGRQENRGGFVVPTGA